MEALLSRHGPWRRGADGERGVSCGIARGRAVRRADPDVVELRGTHARRDRGGPERLGAGESVWLGGLCRRPHSGAFLVIASATVGWSAVYGARVVRG